MHRLLAIGVSVCGALLLSGTASAWSWPSDGAVLRPFAFGNDAYAAGQHRGIDIAGVEGGAVSAPASGTVTFAGSVPTHGRGVTLLTADGYAVTLFHLGTIAVAKGDVVDEGSPVGTMGWSGEREHAVPTVHLGIRVASSSEGYVDPLGLLPPRSVAAPPAPPSPVSMPSPVSVPSPAPVAAPPTTAPAPAAATASAAASPDSPSATTPATPTPIGASSSADAPGAFVEAPPPVEASREAAGIEVQSPLTIERHSVGAKRAAVAAAATRRPAGSTTHARPAAVGDRSAGDGEVGATAAGVGVAAERSPVAVVERSVVRRSQPPSSPSATDIAGVAERRPHGMADLLASALGRRTAPGSTSASVPPAIPSGRTAPDRAVTASSAPEESSRVPVFAALLLAGSAVLGAWRLARRIGRDGAVLRHDADLLRELDAAHRSRLHDRRGRRVRATPAAARP